MRIIVLAILNKFRLFFGILLALILCQLTLQAQIIASSSSYTTKTFYSVGKQDNIFVFADEVGAGVGELKAVSSNKTLGWTFTWTKWDSGTNTYGGAYPVDNGKESTLSALDNGLYRVTIEKVGEATQNYQAWVINHKKNENTPGFIKQNIDCEGVHFKSSLNTVVYKYNDYPSAEELKVPSPITFILRRDGLDINSVEVMDTVETIFVNLIDGEAFEGERDYTLSVNTKYGFEYTSGIVESKTHVVDPSFSFTPEMGEAPLDVKFKIDNENSSATYEWFLYNATTFIDGPVDTRDSLLTDLTFNPNSPYLYEHPGKYDVKVIATSIADETCVYYSDFKTISVEESLFKVPNVFTPNGDGVNDEFKILVYSVKSYSVKIFNRWGRLVYQFQESDVLPGAADKKSSKGWNGKINGKLASPGTYFYVIEAEGREFEGRHYVERGSLTLLHDK